MADQKAMNRQTWAALKSEGFAPGSNLPVDAYFFLEDEASTRALGSELQERGWRADVSVDDLNIVASCTIARVQLTDLDRMVDELETLAARHCAEFDGWGAQL